MACPVGRGWLSRRGGDGVGRKVVPARRGRAGRWTGTCMRVAEWNTTRGSPGGRSRLSVGQSSIASPVRMVGGSLANCSRVASSRAASDRSSGHTRARSQRRSVGSVTSSGLRSMPIAELGVSDEVSVAIDEQQHARAGADSMRCTGAKHCCPMAHSANLRPTTRLGTLVWTRRVRDQRDQLGAVSPAEVDQDRAGCCRVASRGTDG